MDSGTLRLILIAAGVLLLAGIYYFGQKKGREKRPQAHEWQDETPIEVLEEREEEITWVAESSNEKPFKPEPEIEPFIEIEEPLTEEAINPKPLDRKDQQELFAEEQEALTVLANDELPQKILQIIIVANGEPFTGEAILQAAEACNLQHGDMQIFHHYESSAKQPLFSMASMVEPGNFPIKAMAGFTTPGLALFAQLPTSKPGLEIYDNMIATANALAEKLNAELRDATNSVLSRQTIEHTRGEILEHQRQVQLASKRP